MTTGIFIIDCLIAGFLGILCHVFFVKLPALSKTAANGNIDFSPSVYFKKDWIALAGSFLTVVVCAFVLDEVLRFQPAVAKYLKFAFVFVGYTGSSILQAAFNKTNESLQKIIDLKTNIADGVVENPNSK